MNNKTKQMLAPCECKNEAQLLKLRNDNYDLTDFWILTDGYNVSIRQQANGRPSVQQIKVPVRIFNTLIRWYQKSKKVRK